MEKNKNEAGVLKSKTMKVIATTALLATLGAGAVFASEGKNIFASNQLQEELAGTVPAESSIAIEAREDGKTYYSTDGGETWSLEVPEGFKTSNDGEGNHSVFSEAMTERPAAETEGSIAVEAREDGKTYYSTDGGETWSLEVPEGFKMSNDGEGNHSVFSEGVTEGPAAGTEGSIAVEAREDGKTYYSTDGGKTWSLEIPEGYEASFDDNEGTVTVDFSGNSQN
ncbi:WD40/YVTN/BNR-like repeat-containing protein [Paenibacillus senegalensis]|uniref:WD40/YVTN/BNR-like repeat-containing protein n=1 Tax=Paenibacillus senegalensis TaxID=1465766 RepID=UPI000289D33B|nr:sialidase family protein [Paenibacillus senegalensis]